MSKSSCLVVAHSITPAQAPVRTGQHSEWKWAPGRAPMPKFPTPLQWRPLISFSEPLLIDQYLSALAPSLWCARFRRPTVAAPLSTPPLAFAGFSACPARPRTYPIMPARICRHRDGVDLSSTYHKIRVLAFCMAHTATREPPCHWASLVAG